MFHEASEWREGIQIFFKVTPCNSNTSFYEFAQKFRFIQDCLNIPYMLESIPVENGEYDIKYETILPTRKAETIT